MNNVINNTVNNNVKNRSYQVLVKLQKKVLDITVVLRLSKER